MTSVVASLPATDLYQRSLHSFRSYTYNWYPFHTFLWANKYKYNWYACHIFGFSHHSSHTPITIILDVISSTIAPGKHTYALGALCIDLHTYTSSITAMVSFISYLSSLMSNWYYSLSWKIVHMYLGYELVIVWGINWVIIYDFGLNHHK